MDKTFLNRILPFLPAVISGLLIVLSFPLFDLYALAWIAFIPLFCSFWEKNWKESFQAGFIFGMVYFFGTLYWIYHSINHFGGFSFVASLIIVLVLSAYLSLFTALFSALFSLSYRKTKFPAFFVAPVLWVSIEFLRSYALTGFPWSSVGYSQYRFLPLIQVADITGIYGISFLVLSFNGAIADIILLRKRLKEMPLFPLSYIVAGVISLSLLLVAVVGYGFWRLNEVRTGRSVPVSVVQGNIDQDKKWDPSFQNEVMNIYTALSQEALKDSPALIIWPETAVPFFFNADPEHSSRLLQFQRQTGAWLLFGSVLLKKPSPSGQELSNSAVLLDREGKNIFTYDKIHLVPFGEYVPLRKVLFFVDKLVEGVGDYVPGRQYLKVETDFGSFGTLICYEIIFPGLVRKFYTQGGDFIVTITNDAWFGKTAGPYQHFSMAVFRAIENRKPVIRAANTGISGFIDSSGRILSQAGLFTRQTLSMPITTDSTMTFYTKYGDLFSFLCIVVSIIMIVNTDPRRQS